jgi:hypothetical protein
LYSPSWVPVIVERTKTRSSSAIISSTETWRSGNASKYDMQPRVTASRIFWSAQYSPIASRSWALNTCS